MSDEKKATHVLGADGIYLIKDPSALEKVEGEVHGIAVAAEHAPKDLPPPTEKPEVEGQHFTGVWHTWPEFGPVFDMNWGMIRTCMHYHPHGSPFAIILS